MSQIVIESLFPEFCNQGGDNGNIMYLKASLPEAEFVETHFTDKPAFVTRDVSMIYLGYMTEAEQEKVAAKLMPYRDRLNELIDSGSVVLATGNAAELLGRAIVYDSGHEVPCLGLFDFTTSLSLNRRYTEVYLGEFTPALGAQPLDIVGYKIQFTQAKGDNRADFFCKNKVGFGLCVDDAFEGFRRNNLFATWLTGPLLPLNPLFTEYLMGLMGAEGARAAFREEAVEAYRKRIEEFKTPGIKMPI